MISLHPIKPHFLLVCFRRRETFIVYILVYNMLSIVYVYILCVLSNVCLHTHIRTESTYLEPYRYLSYRAFCFVSDCIFISLQRSKSKYTFLDIYDFPRRVIKYHCNGSRSFVLIYFGDFRSFQTYLCLENVNTMVWVYFELYTFISTVLTTSVASYCFLKKNYY